MDIQNEKKLLETLTRIADALDKQNKLQEKFLLIEKRRYKHELKTLNENTDGKEEVSEE